MATCKGCEDNFYLDTAVGMDILKPCDFFSKAGYARRVTTLALRPVAPLRGNHVAPQRASGHFAADVASDVATQTILKLAC